MKKVFLILAFLLSISQAKTNIYTSSEANMHIGEFAAVEGTLYNVYLSSKGNLFLNVVLNCMVKMLKNHK